MYRRFLYNTRENGDTNFLTQKINTIQMKQIYQYLIKPLFKN